MSRIPLVPVSFDEKGTPVTGKLSFSGYSPTMRSITSDLKACVRGVSKKLGKENPMVMIDIEGISKLEMDPKVLKKFRTKRLDVMILASIVSTDDLFDAFYIGIDGLAVPYHTVRSDTVMKEMNGLSDKVLPIVFTDGWNAATSKGSENVLFPLRKLSIFGFKKIGVIDVSGRFNKEMWASVFKESAEIVPFVHDQTPEMEAALGEIGFNDVFIEWP